MTIINFPNSPVLDDEYTFESKTWKWNGSGWALQAVAGTGTGGTGGTGATTLDGLTDVVVTTPTNSQVLKYDTATSKWINGSGAGGATTIVGLTDVAITTPSDNQLLTYNTATGKWINGTLNFPYFVLSGPSVVYQSQVVTYIINDYDVFTTYSVSVTAGSASIAGNTITFTAPATTGNVTLSLSNGTLTRSVVITILPSSVTTPTIITPTNNSNIYLGPVTVNFTTSAFQALGFADTHLNTDWQLATDSAFTTVVQSALADTAKLTTWTLSFSTPAVYYVRVRHRGVQNGVSEYSATVQFTVLPKTVATPTITSPVSGTIGYETPNVTFTSSAFTYLGTFDTHASSTWQLATNAGFTTGVQTSTSGNLVEWRVTGLSVLTTYYVRVTHTGASNGSSITSSTVNFTTTDEFKAFIATPLPTPTAFGDALEGGFYAGMIWNVAMDFTPGSYANIFYGALGYGSQYDASVAVGQRTYNVPDMTNNPTFYRGQAVEIRKKADPSIKMIGTVASAGSTVLKINVTSVANTSSVDYTFSYGDAWVIMAQYRVIVAPRASGESNSTIQWAASSGQNGYGANRISEGLANTNYLVAAGGEFYPAAWFCKNLSIGGYTDWYLPARDELELVYRNLKPTTQVNATDRRSSQSYAGANNGSYGEDSNDSSITMGRNFNSSPSGANYTTTVPGQVAAGKFFRSGEVEALLNMYWSSSHSQSGGSYNAFVLGSTSDGNQSVLSVSTLNASKARAVRRSII